MFLVGLGVVRDPLRGQRRPRLRAARRISDHAGEIADQKDHTVTEVLEMPHLAKQDGVPEMDVRGRGVEPDLDGQGLSGLDRSRQLRAKLLFGRDVDRAAGQQLHLLVDRFERRFGLRHDPRLSEAGF